MSWNPNRDARKRLKETLRGEDPPPNPIVDILFYAFIILFIAVLVYGILFA